MVHKSKSLVLVESPTKARTISQILKGDFVVLPTMGHIIDLPENQLGVSIKRGFEPYYIVMPNKKKIIRQIEQEAKESREIFVATDPDREGEAIGFLLKEYLKKKGLEEAQFRRVEFHEITPMAIKIAFQNPREFDENLVEAQRARRILDRIVGYYISPILWRKVAKGLSAGRVQSVALRMIVEREEEIRRFVPKEYWEIVGFFSNLQREDLFEFKLHRINGEKVEIGSEDEAKKIENDLTSVKTWKVLSVERKEKKKNAPPPFTTSSLQQSAFNKLRFSSNKTMQIAQQLYEGVQLAQSGSIGLITYMRTDSVNVAQEALNEVRDFIRDKLGPEFLPEKPNKYKSKKGAQEAHEAIRPTSVYRTPESVKDQLTKDQYLLYKLIWERFVASQMRPAKYIQQIVLVGDGDERFEFRSTRTQLVSPGFLKIYQEDEESNAKEDTAKVDLSSGQSLVLKHVEKTQHFTKPPARYTDASLVKELEEKGIGRPSTYAPTIQTIIRRGYVVRQKGSLVPTELGEKVVGLLTKFFPEVMDYEFTAKMEEDLDKIEEGQENRKSLLEEFYPRFVERVSYASKNMEKAVEKTDEVCEKCGSPMVIRWGKSGKFLSCSNYPNCRNTRPLPIGVKCPICGGELVPRRAQKGRRKGNIFYGCSNYPKCTYTTTSLPVKK